MRRRGKAGPRSQEAKGSSPGKYLRHFSTRKSSTACVAEEESLGLSPGSQAHWVGVLREEGGGSGAWVEVRSGGWVLRTPSRLRTWCSWLLMCCRELSKHWILSGKAGLARLPEREEEAGGVGPRPCGHCGSREGRASVPNRAASQNAEVGQGLRTQKALQGVQPVGGQSQSGSSLSSTH